MAEVTAWVDGVAADLRRHGLVGGDRVSIWMSNKLEAIITFLACSREGFACNPSLHRTYTCAEIVQLLDNLQAKAFLTEHGWGADRTNVDFDAMLAQVSSLRKVYSRDAFPQAGAGDHRSRIEDPDKVSYLAFTSGTTGAPKCVMHSDNTLLANARDLVRDWRHGPQTVLLSCRRCRTTLPGSRCRSGCWQDASW